jgi:hypothetical protein
VLLQGDQQMGGGALRPDAVGRLVTMAETADATDLLLRNIGINAHDLYVDGACRPPEARPSKACPAAAAAPRKAGAGEGPDRP